MTEPFAPPPMTVATGSQSFVYLHREQDERATYESACLLVPYVWFMDCSWCASEKGVGGPYCDD